MISEELKRVLITAAIINFSTFAAAAIVSIMLVRRKRLEKKEYPEEYIHFQQNFSRSFGIQFMLFIILVQALFFIIMFNLNSGLSSRIYLYTVLIPTLVLALPFALLKTVQMNKGYKRIAEETGYELAADFGFIKLKKIFNARIELAASLLIISYILLFAFQFESTIIILYVLLLWFFAAAVRFTRYSIKPILRDQYLTMARMMLIYQALLLFLLFIPRGIELWDAGGNASRIMFLILSAGLTAKLVYYAVKYPAFVKSINDGNQPAE